MNIKEARSYTVAKALKQTIFNNVGEYVSIRFYKVIDGVKWFRIVASVTFKHDEVREIVTMRESDLTNFS